MKRTRTLSFEQLENRLTPTVWNNPWPDGTHLTLSFVPDGTIVGGRSSSLFRTLNARGPTALWQHQILQALQTWAVQTNLNIGVVADDGSPLGAPGQPQSDPRFGDIRVAAIPMAPDVMAITTPFDPLAGTWSGDVRLNSNYLFDLQGTGGVDFLTAMVHEVGHSFGLPDILDQSSVEYRYYQGVRTTLGASDVTAIQALYGARQGDAFEGTAGNGTFTSARALTLLQNSDGSLGIQANADVTTAQDIDYYRFTAPLNAGSFTVRLQTKGVSLLVPSVTVYDSSQRVVGSAVSTDPLGGDLLVNVPQYNPLGTYYVKVQAATTDVFGVGGYGLQVRAIPLVSGLLGAVNTTVNTVSTVLANNDLHTNDTILTASLLPPLFSQTNSRFTAAFRGSISDGWDVDFYKVQAPTPPAGTPNVLTAMVWGTQTNGLSPHLAVYDAYGQQVNADVLVNENGTYTVQVANAVPGAAYYVKVDAAGAAAGHTTGNYFLALQFGPNAQNLQALGSGTLGATVPETSGTLAVGTTMLFHFVLSANASNAPSGTGVRLTILDSNGQVVGSLLAGVAQPVSLTMLLSAGTYRFIYDAVGPSGQPLPSVTYTLAGVGVSDPIGPQPVDPTMDPQSTTAPSDGTTSDSSTSTDT